VEEVTNPPREPARRERAAAPTGARRERRRHPTTGDHPVGVTGEHGHAGQLGRRRGAVGVDEGDELGVTAAERLHQHAALAELGELVQHDAPVGGGVGAHDVGGVVVAAVEGHEEADVGLGEAAPVGPERAIDALLFVVGRDDDVQGHVCSLLRSWGMASGLRGDRPAPPLRGSMPPVRF
jgi:hypothetical protein